MSALRSAPDGLPGPSSDVEIEIESRSPFHPASVGRAVGGRIGADATLAGGLFIVVGLMVLGLLAGVLSPYDPVKQDIMHTLAPPGTAGHLLGTDGLGRDTLSRLLYGARNDLFLAFACIAIPFTCGTALGVLAGYRGGWFDRVMVGVIDVIIAFPILVLLIALVFVLGPGVKTIIVAVDRGRLGGVRKIGSRLSSPRGILGVRDGCPDRGDPNVADPGSSRRPQSDQPVDRLCDVGRWC